MIRYAFALTLALGTLAGVAAAMEASAAKALADAAAATRQTVIEKNSPYPMLGAVVTDECTGTSCADVQS